jgi:hypothetical protein
MLNQFQLQCLYLLCRCCWCCICSFFPGRKLNESINYKVAYLYIGGNILYGGNSGEISHNDKL